ncbi:MAG TPA: 3-hydroxyacyl-CoA dehydrogenase NAD-binding domain-containing protein, partial [Arenibacter sp.]|nr:3-hydroxyacyl-CoA dehydrogenase NAD-binding domain-containing protein [Arenibacter sp.]
MKKIAVIGAGTMGNGIAHVFAQNGYITHLIDLSQGSLDRGMATIGKNLDRMVAKEVIGEADKKNTLGKISTFTSLVEGAKEADLVIEAATENTDLKLKIFGDLDRICPAS